MFFFFFQAEDGIRDIGVTGVQTCALPISVKLAADADSLISGSSTGPGGSSPPHEPTMTATTSASSGVTCSRKYHRVTDGRSEERRVGKEGRSRWSPYH